MVDANPQLIRGIILCSIGWLMAVVATAIPYWWSTKIWAEQTGYYLDIGLFKVCYSEICRSFDGSTPAWAAGAQACMVISILLIGSSIILCLLYIFILKDRQSLITAAGIMNYVASALLPGAVLIVLLVLTLERPFGEYIIGIPHASFFLTLFADGFIGGGGRQMWKSRNPGGVVVSTPATAFTNQTAVVMQPVAPTSGGMVLVQPGVQYPGGMVLGQPGVQTSGGMVLGQPGVQYPGGMVLGQPGVPTSGGMVFMQPPGYSEPKKDH